ncbi:protein phosphatase Mn(2+)-dependent 1K-like [Dermatophagoides pteronyssinus]|uniref:protein phosphatase Mn(2+)-dependent 1K-like n=1 Tax=Dermatophagoides pteronyssinus TaxID=6956 RepID=UPI003F67A6BE
MQTLHNTGRTILTTILSSEKSSSTINSSIIRLLSKRFLARMLSDPENKGSQQRHVNFDTLGTWDNRIDFSLLLQQSIKHGKPIPKISVNNIGHANVIGRRLQNEDYCNAMEIKPNMIYFAIFDGHGGDICARFCNEHLPEHIKFWIERGETNLEIVLQNAFTEVNNSFARYITYTKNDGYNNERSTSGTTATVCLLHNSTKLVVAYVGDSRMFLCRDGQCIKLTNDHTANVKAEKDRIINSNGFIKYDSLGRGLINGRLAMTRSIGDLDLKPFGVIALPDTRTYEIKHGRDSFVVLTTDGITDVMNDREIVNAVKSCQQPNEAAKFLTDQALHCSCDDNATALVVPFGAWGKYRNHRQTYNQFFSFGRQLQNSARF